MNQITCYKLVVRTADDTLVSLCADALPRGWPVVYRIGQPAHSHTGELFAFDTEESATTAQAYFNRYQVELYQALAQAPVRPIDSACSLWGSDDDFYDFWNPGLPYDATIPTPPGTITTRSLTLIKRLP